MMLARFSAILVKTNEIDNRAASGVGWAAQERLGAPNTPIYFCGAWVKAMYVAICLPTLVDLSEGHTWVNKNPFFNTYNLRWI